MLSDIKNKLNNLRIKVFLWLMGKDNHEMWYELTKRYVTDMNHMNFGSIGEHCSFGYGATMNPNNIYMEEYSRVQNHLNFISYTGKLIVKKYAAIGAGCIIIPGDHVPTVGVPQFLSGRLHINDVDGEIVVGEDAWVGAGTILLSHCSIGRGAVVAAGAVVSKHVPPYAVVAGVPAKIIATRFTIDQILKHESIIYPVEERMSRDELDCIFLDFYQGMRSIGKGTMSMEDKIKLEREISELGMTTY